MGPQSGAALSAQLRENLVLALDIIGLALEPDRQGDQLPIGRLFAFGAKACRAPRLACLRTAVLPRQSWFRSPRENLKLAG